jgi:hypothetical protein
MWATAQTAGGKSGIVDTCFGSGFAFPDCARSPVSAADPAYAVLLPDPCTLFTEISHVSIWK